MNKKTNKFIINESELGRNQLVFKPIDTSIYDKKISQIKIDYDDDIYETPKFSFNNENAKFLFFGSKKGIDSSKINIVINPIVDDDYDPLAFNTIYKRFEDNISNVDSISHNKRKAFLTDKKSWSTISLDNIESKFKL